MQIAFITLSLDEARDATIMANVARHFSGALTLAGVSHMTINPIDAPDVGATVNTPASFPVVPVAPPAPPPPLNPPLDTAAVFGGAAAAPAIPPAPPVPPAPPATPAGPAAPTGGVAVDGQVLDSTGLPWDHRIHSSTKSQTKAGAWVSKRGINDPGLVKRVEAELRAALAAPGAAAPAATPPIPQPPVAPGVPVPPAAPAGAPQVETVPTLMVKLSPHMMSGLITPERSMEVLTRFGMPSMPALMQRPDLVAAVSAEFDRCIPFWMAGLPTA